MKQIPPIAAAQVKSLSKVDGRHSVGGAAGLHLRVRGSSALWVCRVRVGGKRVDCVIGSYPDTDLSTARLLARELRQDAAAGIEPKGRRKDKAPEPAPQKTLEEVFTMWLAKKAPEFRKGTKTEQEVLRRAQIHIFPKLGSLPVAEVTTAQIVEAFAPTWAVHVQTYRKARQDLQSVFEYAELSGWRTLPNPATSKRLEVSLPRMSKLMAARAKNHPALAWGMAPVVWARLQASDSISSRLARWTMLSALRPNEAAALRWDWIDWEALAVNIPADAMKQGRAHTIPLTVEIAGWLKSTPRMSLCPFVFPSPNGKQAMHNESSRWTFKKALPEGHQDATLHGMRSTFVVWGVETQTASAAAMDVAIAHAPGNAVFRAYNRSDYLQERRHAYGQWFAFLTGQAAAAVIPLIGAA